MSQSVNLVFCSSVLQPFWSDNRRAHQLARLTKHENIMPACTALDASLCGVWLYYGSPGYFLFPRPPACGHKVTREEEAAIKRALFPGSA